MLWTRAICLRKPNSIQNLVCVIFSHKTIFNVGIVIGEMCSCGISRQAVYNLQKLFKFPSIKIKRWLLVCKLHYKRVLGQWSSKCIILYLKLFFPMVLMPGCIYQIYSLPSSFFSNNFKHAINFWQCTYHTMTTLICVHSVQKKISWKYDDQKRIKTKKFLFDAEQSIFVGGLRLSQYSFKLYWWLWCT